MSRLITMCEETGQGQDRRVAKAIAEGPEYQWMKSPEGWTVTTKSGCYLVTEHGCSCPDHTNRLAGTLGLCKHRVALAHRLLVDGTPAPPPAAKPKGLPLMTDAEVARMDRLWN